MAQHIEAAPAGGRLGRHYHHGDLRRELLRVARDEIARHGAQSVSLSSLARLAGVSQPAPYRHFPDRNTLLQAVAAEAFADFAHTLARAAEEGEPADALAALALAYVAFGENNIELYRLMFASGLTPEAENASELGCASAAAFGILRMALSAVVPDAGEELLYLAWAQLHGLVMLKADGFIRSPLRRFATRWSARLGGREAVRHEGLEDLHRTRVPDDGAKPTPA